jgi:predicted kinase
LCFEAAMPDTQLIVFAGLPGTGKSSLARAVAREFKAVYLDKDTIKDTAMAVGRELKLAQAAELAGPLSYELLLGLARDNLTLGLSVVLDSPAGYQTFQDKVARLARSTDADMRVIECICSNEGLLRDRVERRGADLPDYRTRDWAGYQEDRALFQRFSGPRLVIDTAEILQINTRKVLGYLDTVTKARDPG